MLTFKFILMNYMPLLVELKWTNKINNNNNYSNDFAFDHSFHFDAFILGDNTKTQNTNQFSLSSTSHRFASRLSFQFSVIHSFSGRWKEIEKKMLNTYSLMKHSRQCIKWNSAVSSHAIKTLIWMMLFSICCCCNCQLSHRKDGKISIHYSLLFRNMLLTMFEYVDGTNNWLLK